MNNIDCMLNDYILNQVQNGKWTSEHNKKKINILCFPLKTRGNNLFSFTRISIEKQDNNYKGIIVYESDKPFMKTSDTDEDDDLENLNQATFYTQIHTKLNKCIISLVKLLSKITLCNSCNNIIECSSVLEKEKKLCSTCLIQLFIEQPKTECCICMDDTALLLPYTLECNHTFHFSCIAKSGNKCPLCRRLFNL